MKDLSYYCPICNDTHIRDDFMDNNDFTDTFVDISNFMAGYPTTYYFKGE